MSRYPYGNKYKFKSLQVYSSTEWMMGATKKYRQVFDRNEVNYIRAEFAFYNKLFDEEDWEADICLKSFALEGNERREISNQPERLKITADKNIVYFYKGWGTDKIGGFWRKGSYVWEAYIDGDLVSSQKFFIEDIGKVNPDKNPYFDVVSLKVYNGDYDGWSQSNRKYLKRFDRDKTQFVWAEFKIRNKVESDWNCELFINFYDSAGQQKGQAITLDYIKRDTKNKVYTFQEGWGSKQGGSWKDERYTAEVVFMDTLVAAVAFDVGEEEVEGDAESVSLTTKVETNTENATPSSPQTLEEVMKDLEDLVGLHAIKKKIKDHISYLNFLQLRKEKGFEDSDNLSLHSVFTGNPGTGKTTVVNLLGKIYHEMGLLSSGHVHEVDRAELVGEFIGQTAPKVKKAIEEARGGILFIDEAYMLVRENEDAKDFGKEVIEVLIKEMSDGEGDVAVMVAGYPQEMKVFLDSNPGLRSRFKYYFHFDDYTPEELIQIADYACERRSVKFTGEARQEIQKILTEAFRNRDKYFGNARYVYSLIDESKMNLGLRLMTYPNVRKLPNDVLSTIAIEDVRKIAVAHSKTRIDIPIDEALLRETLHELNTLVGLSNIKKDVNELVKLVRYYRETGKDVLNRFSLHTVFKGNPGTGKTTVSRIMGKIYKALGLLERGHVIETDREGLIAGYTGQTAIKTKQRIDEAQGGVLFIDEAYSLADSHQTSGYGSEAIEVLLKNMEDKRGEFAVIVAGYPDNMDVFLRANPGLRSRFDRIFNFEDFTAEQLYKIALLMFNDENLNPNKEATNFLQNHLNDLHQKRDRYFGNARAVRRIVEETIKHQHLRMASIPVGSRTTKMQETIIMEDVKELTREEAKQGTIGFMASR